MSRLFIPIEHLDHIRRGHSRSVELLRRAGIPDRFIESVEVAIACENHRWAWRPPFIQTLLVAESHVFTLEDEVRWRILADHLPKEARHAPVEFVRLVYCLAYGESEILVERPTRRNTGTSQYWKLFGDLAGSPPYPRKPSPSNVRLAWKTTTLQRLKERGIWLLDGSFHAVYRPRGTRLRHDIAKALHRIWYEEYGSSIRKEASRAKVWCIGKAVLEAIGHEMQCGDWIYQPNARIGKEVRERRFMPLLQCVQHSATNEAAR